MAINSGMMSSNRQDWSTPWDFYTKLDAEFHFTLDACATAKNTKHPNYFSPEDDALTKNWTGIIFMNPPYGRGIIKWVRKAYEEAQAGATVVCLLPARTDTAWFHDFCKKGDITFVRGRIKFSGAQAAPFPSMIVVFRGF